MRKLFIISSFILASCSHKILPQQPAVVIKDSVVEHNTILYHSDTVLIPGDTTEIWQAIPCPQAKMDTIIKRGRTTLSAKISNGYLQINCKTDSLLKVIDSLQTIVSSKEFYQHKETTVIKEVPVIKNKVPGWCWKLLIICIAYLGARVLIWRYRLPIHL